MLGRAPNLQKQLQSRIYGLGKKANELNRRYGVKVALIVDDVFDDWTYQSDESFPNNFDSLSRGQNRMFPSDFITLSEYQRVSGPTASMQVPVALPESAPDSSRRLDDEDFALLEAFGVGEAAPVSVPSSFVSSQIEQNRTSSYGMSKNARFSPTRKSHGLKRAGRGSQPIKVKPVTRSTKGGLDDQYKFLS